MKKILPEKIIKQEVITKCVNCIYYTTNGTCLQTRDTYYSDDGSGSKETHRHIYSPTRIPNWCPLENESKPNRTDAICKNCAMAILTCDKGVCCAYCSYVMNDRHIPRAIDSICPTPHFFNPKEDK